jgi:KRAB domain-containing zinc finger protein
MLFWFACRQRSKRKASSVHKIQYTLEIEGISESSDSEEVIDNSNDASFVPAFPCKYCDQSFFYTKTLKKHIKKEHVDKFKCPICNLQLNGEGQLRQHYRTHEKMKKIEEYSKLAGKVYKNLPRHEKVECEFCHKFFRKIKEHIMTEHTKDKPYHCTQCTKSFAAKNNLNAHVQKVHVKAYAKVCRFCGRGFFTQESLESHERTHTGEKPFSCDICGKKFYSQKVCQTHAGVHVDTANFECELCAKKFKTVSALKQHKKFHDDSNKKFKCTLCGRGFVNKAILKNHIITHTKVKPFECDTCGHCFRTKSELALHIARHSNVKPHICEICGRRYFSKYHLIRHTQRAHKDSHLYVSCDVCGNLFATYNSMMGHKLNKHRTQHENTN